MSCSKWGNELRMRVYYQLVSEMNLQDHQLLDDYSATKFVESVERRDPQLVAVTLAKIRLELI